MEVLRCRRRIIELYGKKGEKGILKLLDQPEGMQCQLITEISDNKMLYLKNSAGIVSFNMKDSYMLANSSADDIKAVAVVCKEDICLTGGDNIDWTSLIKNTNEKKEKTKKAFDINEKENLKKEARAENEKLKTDERENNKQVNNDMLLKMLPHLLKNGEKDGQDMSKFFSMMEMMNGKNNSDTGMLEKMMTLLSNDSQKKYDEEKNDKEISEENNIDIKSVVENINEEKNENIRENTKKDVKIEEDIIENKPDEVTAEEEKLDIEKLNQDKKQSEKENVEELEELEDTDYCDLNKFEWSRIEYPSPRIGYYISGSAIIKGLKVYAIGIPGEFSYKPPPWQGEFTRFFNYLGQGYWVRVVAKKEKESL